MVNDFFINVGSGFPIVLRNCFTNMANVEEQLVTQSVFCVCLTIAPTLSGGNRVFEFGGGVFVVANEIDWTHLPMIR